MLFYGHRGGRGDGWPPENSLAAFERAKKNGADGIEIDVRSCASGEAVVFHDRDLTRATQGRDRRRIEDVSWNELSRIALFGAAEYIPLLKDVLDYCESSSLRLNVEIKYDVPSKKHLVRAVSPLLRTTKAEFLVSSFEPRILWMIRLSGVRAQLAWLTHAKQRYAPLALRMLARKPWFDGVHLERAQATRELIHRFHRRGLFVGVWTVNEISAAEELTRAGVDWIISDVLTNRSL